MNKGRSSVLRASPSVGHRIHPGRNAGILGPNANRVVASLARAAATAVPHRASARVARSAVTPELKFSSGASEAYNSRIRFFTRSVDGIHSARAHRATHIGYPDPVLVTSTYPVTEHPDQGAEAPVLVLLRRRLRRGSWRYEC